MLKVIRKLVEILVLISLISSFPLIGFSEDAEGLAGTRSDYETPDKLLVWTMDDLAANATPPINLTGNVYRIFSNITISTKDTLVIEPGQVLRFGNNTSLIVLGNIKAKGTVSSKIIFGSNATSAEPGDWNGIKFDGSKTPGHQADSILDHCIVEYATTGISGVNTSVTISNSRVSLTGGHGMKFISSSPLIRSNEVTESGMLENSSGIYIDDSNAVLDNNHLYNTSIYGIFVEGLRSAVITNNTITNVSTGTYINNSRELTIENNHYTSVSTGIVTANKTSVNITGNTFEFYDGIGILAGTNNLNITGNYMQFLHTGISITSKNNINIISNVIENVTDALSLDDLSSSRISLNVLNFTTNECLDVRDSFDINVSYNRIYNHFGDGIYIGDSEDISVFRNEVYFGHGSSINISSSIGTDIIGNRIYYSFNKGLTLSDTLPDSFNSNFINRSAKFDLEVLGDLRLVSLNNTIRYSKLYLDQDIKFIARNYFTVRTLDKNDQPIVDVTIRILINNAVSQEFFTDSKGEVRNILLTYREYDGPSVSIQDQIFITAEFGDLEFDYSPFEIDASSTSELSLHTNFIPVIKVHSPPENKTLSGEVYINGTAFDLDSTILNLWIQVGMDPWESVIPGNPEWTVWHYLLDTTEYSDGFYSLNFSITDGQSTGRLSYPVIIFNNDIKLKELSVTIIDPLESEAVWDTVTIVGTTTVGDFPIRTVVVQVDDGEWSNATSGSESGTRSEAAGGLRSEAADWSSWTYILDTRTLDNGEHSVFAFVTDGEDVGAETRTIFVTNVPQNETVKLNADFVSPEDGGTVSGDVYITGIVWGSNDPILDLKLTIDNRAISSTFNVQGPNWWLWNYTWNTSQESNGLHEIEVWARNKSLSMVDDIVVIVDNEIVNDSRKSEMNIVILSPKEADILNETVRVQGITWSETEAVTNVQVRFDEGDWQDTEMIEDDWIRWSYLWDTLAYANGIHFIDAKMDTGVQSIISTVFVIVDNVGLDSDLSIVLISPRNGSTVNGTVTVKGVAWYGDHPIISVDVQFGPYLWKTAEPLRADWSSWFYEWDTTKLDDGEYNLQCRVYDGFETVKYSIVVIINNNKGEVPNNGKKPPGSNGTDGPSDDGGLSTNSGFLSVLIVVNVIITGVLLFVILNERRRKGVEGDAENDLINEESDVEMDENGRVIVDTGDDTPEDEEME